MSERSKILIIGALGSIGLILAKELDRSHEVILADLPEQVESAGMGVALDVRNYQQVLEASADGCKAIINLAGLRRQPQIVQPETFQNMMQTYIKGTYNILQSARSNQVPKVILASTNHVTGQYEEDGVSTLGRPIVATDSPAPDDIYAAMKLFCEEAGRVYSNSSLSVICLRLGTVLGPGDESFITYKRIMRTFLSHMDMVNLFECALSADIDYGVYYGVSDNPQKPWSIDEAKLDIGYSPKMNSVEMLQKAQLTMSASGKSNELVKE